MKKLILKLLLWLIQHHPDVAHVTVITHQELDDNFNMFQYTGRPVPDEYYSGFGQRWLQ